MRSISIFIIIILLSGCNKSNVILNSFEDAEVSVERYIIKLYKDAIGTLEYTDFIQMKPEGLSYYHGDEQNIFIVYGGTGRHKDTYVFEYKDKQIAIVFYSSFLGHAEVDVTKRDGNMYLVVVDNIGISRIRREVTIVNGYSEQVLLHDLATARSVKINKGSISFEKPDGSLVNVNLPNLFKPKNSKSHQ